METCIVGLRSSGAVYISLAIFCALEELEFIPISFLQSQFYPFYADIFCTFTTLRYKKCSLSLWNIFIFTSEEVRLVAVL
jgi:hypothetical protein